MVNLLKNQYKEKHQIRKESRTLKKEKQDKMEKLNDKLVHLETLIEDKQKTIDFYNSFHANLVISGFEEGNEMKRGKYLKDMGLPTELLFDEEKASYPDKTCVLNDIGLTESLRYMKTLNEKKYNDFPLELTCSVYMVKSKLPSPSPSPSKHSFITTPLLSSEEDVENGNIKSESIIVKKKRKQFFPDSCWRKNSDTSSQHHENSDLEMQNNSKEVQKADIKIYEEISDSPPTSDAGTPSLEEKPDAQVNFTELTEECKKEDFGKQEEN